MAAEVDLVLASFPLSACSPPASSIWGDDNNATVRFTSCGKRIYLIHRNQKRKREEECRETEGENERDRGVSK